MAANRRRLDSETTRSGLGFAGLLNEWFVPLFSRSQQCTAKLKQHISDFVFYCFFLVLLVFFFLSFELFLFKVYCEFYQFYQIYQSYMLPFYQFSFCFPFFLVFSVSVFSKTSFQKMVAPLVLLSYSIWICMRFRGILILGDFFLFVFLLVCWFGLFCCGFFC